MALADELARRDWRVLFAVESETQQAVPALAERYRCVVAPSGNSEEQASFLFRHASQVPAALIVDRYDLDERFERACRRWARLVLAIDDLADRRHDCDILVDMAPSAREAAHRALCGTRARLLLGPRYALLRSQIGAARDAALARRARLDGVRRFYVSLGWTDPHATLPAILDAIRRSRPDCSACVVVGPLPAPLRAAVEARLAQLGGESSLHVGREDVAPLMAGCDLAIGAAGVSALERCVLGLPSLILVVAENQREQGEALASAGAARLSAEVADRVNPAQLAHEIATLSGDGAAMAAMANAAAALCDGLGAGRVAGSLTDMMHRVERPTGCPT
jgi:UDP-2,4-diacetamido-2,4,6-trideoxy-beta-L-altropyranose hydrolase